MALRLTEKEISALAKKLAEKKDTEASKKLEALAKAKLPEAKRILTTLNKLPDSVLGFLYSNRYNKGNVNPSRIAKVLSRNDGEENYSNKSNSKDYEADVVLAAHGCTTMQALCKKLEI